LEREFAERVEARAEAGESAEAEAAEATA